MNASETSGARPAEAGARAATAGVDVRPPMERRNEGEDPPTAGGGSYSAEASRQGYIVLRNPTRRRIFVGGLIALVILLVVIGFLF